MLLVEDLALEPNQIVWSHSEANPGRYWVDKVTVHRTHSPTIGAIHVRGVLDGKEGGAARYTEARHDIVVTDGLPCFATPT